MNRKWNLFICVFVANYQFFQNNCQNMPYKAVIWHALSHEQAFIQALLFTAIFSKRLSFFTVC